MDIRDRIADDLLQQGVRYNIGKLRYDLEHPVAREGLIKVLTKGAGKYEARNWEKGLSWMDTVASLERHLAAWKMGEDIDPETGEYHVDHMQCNTHFLSTFRVTHPEKDDRPHKFIKQLDYRNEEKEHI